MECAVSVPASCVCAEGSRTALPGDPQAGGASPGLQGTGTKSGSGPTGTFSPYPSFYLTTIYLNSFLAYKTHGIRGGRKRFLKFKPFLLSGKFAETENGVWSFFGSKKKKKVKCLNASSLIKIFIF